MNIIYIVIVLILIIYIYLKLKIESEYKCLDIFKKINQEDVDKIYYILFIIDKLFTEYKIIYFMDKSILLGAVRHKGLIPWGNDNINIGILHNNNILQLEKQFNRYSVSITKKKEGYILYYKGQKVFLDIFKKQGDTYINLEEYSKNMYVNNYYYKTEELLPISRYHFGPITLLGPRYSIPYLQRLYREDIFTHCYSNKENKDLRKLKMSINDYSSILPSNNFKNGVI